MTIKNLYPKARPQTIYNVINGRPELPSASTFSRASEATYVDANGIIRTAAIDEPRFNYDPETGEFLGLMLDTERTNLKIYSTDYTKTSNSGGYYGSSNDITTEVALNAGIAPDGTMTASKVGKTDITQTNFVFSRGIDTPNNAYTTGSVFVKANTYKYFKFQYINTSGRGYTLNLNMETDEVVLTSNPKNDYTDESYTVSKYPGGWYRVSVTAKQINSDAPKIAPRLYLSNVWTSEGAGVPTAVGDLFLWGLQVEETYEGSGPNPYIPTEATAVTTSPDLFSLTSSSNFDGGFSLLLDSETTTDDYFYKIKASGTTIAELNNASGTLDWVINGVSAATNGEYPQVGAIQPGRVRTISSFGAADGTTQQNYLYTTGLSFPTNAIVASGANEVEFGPGQTLKAVYLWNGQLGNTEAVSVIKGEYNIVPNEPIKADSYSFAYNTDPTTIGETSITLPYIVPTVSMRVYWGDGTNSAYEQGVTPSHTYPYPGQYRIQIEADDGFDVVRLADIQSTITRVDQWAPQHRVGASGLGFNGDDMVQLLDWQQTLDYIPPFKYTDLTSLYGAFFNTPKLRVNNWDWVPYELESCTTLTNTFYASTKQAPDISDAVRSSFPQLQTSSALTNVTQIWANSGVRGWKDKDGNLTNQPFTDSSQVTNWLNAFANNGITSLSVNTQSATTLEGAFAGNSWTTSPFFSAPNCTNFKSIFVRCKKMTTMNPSIANSTYSNGTNFTSAWEDCEDLTSFPSLNYSSATEMRQTWKNCETMTTWGAPSTTDSFSQVTGFTATWQNCLLLQNMPVINTSGITQGGNTGMDSVWQNCSALTSFPLIDTSNCKTLQTCWSGCSSLTSFPVLDTSSCREFIYSWRGCAGLTSFPLLDFSAAEGLSNTWNTCTGLASFPQIDTSSVTNVGATWRYCSSLTQFPLLDFSSAEQFYRAWDGCTLLEDFPANSFDTTGTLESYAFEESWKNCALTAQSIENILVSLDTNGATGIVLGIDGGTNAGQSTWTAAANTAYTNLINKGWTITFNP
jgi:hypothetical protein